MIIILIIMLIISSCLIFYLNKKLKDKIEKDNHIRLLNAQEQQKNEQLKIQQADLHKDIMVLTNSLIEKTNRNEDLRKDIENKQNQLATIVENNKEVSRLAFKQYQELLENKYNEVEDEFDSQVNSLNKQINSLNQELDKLKQTRAAAHEAMLREQEVKDNKDAYRLVPSASDLADSRRLEVVKRELNKQRILCMLIWQTYWQPLAKKQFPLILQDKTKCGIYKITNLVTDECYIGQSVDVYKRWNDHCKCGLGIDTPPGNKLYKAMQEYGLDNFTFELLTECSQTELNEKEKYFIELYQADTFGYNSTGGNK